MPPKIDWDRQIGRRLKLRDLHAFFMTVQRGSMSKAAQQLGVSQPAVSEAIADLEHALGVRLLDRRPQGVEPTKYGGALLRRSAAVFDELKQSIRDIEFLADPTAGELKIGCPESIAAILPPILESFSRQHPRVVLHVEQVSTATLELPGLRERKFDLIVALLLTPQADDGRGDDLNMEVLFDDHLVVVAGMRSRWARRRKIDLSELVNEPWILATPEEGPHRIMSEAFRARGLETPRISLMTLSVHLRANMLASGHFITTFPSSVVRLHGDRFSLKVLPVELPVRPWPVAIVTLKNRTLSPGVERFIEHVRDFTRPMRERLRATQALRRPA
jgi:DNA-binding transcriptional LysR family regulator